ncbi:glycosyltransferase family 2 protein [Amycolatopsis sp. NPDC059021]|uniref:glycosyltransferase family 2 protein n=1 Tax=Amycolatopsis sp. NPDC059021 TaxID=3346704 RepID=UPI00366FC002
MAFTPRIDVVCTAFNRSDAIRPTIDSVLAQTVEDWSLIVVSDGSTDDTDDVVRSYSDPRIRLIRVEPYGHPGGPRNVGVAAAKAPYVCYLDHDDVWLPEHLEVLLGRLESGAELVATGCVRVDEDGVERERTGLTDLIWHPEIQTVNVMFEPSRVGHARPLLAEAGGWSTARAGFEDWDLWFRLTRAGHDFTLAEERTSVQVLGAGTRRNELRAQHAVVLGRAADDETARAAMAAIAEQRFELRERFIGELCRWYADLAGTGRYHAPPGTTTERIGAHLHDEFLGADKPSLLEQLVYAPVGDSVAIFLPLWCMSADHVRDIGDVMFTRYPGQRAHLRALLGG